MALRRMYSGDPAPSPFKPAIRIYYRSPIPVVHREVFSPTSKASAIPPSERAFPPKRHNESDSTSKDYASPPTCPRAFDANARTVLGPRSGQIRDELYAFLQPPERTVRKPEHADDFPARKMPPKRRRADDEPASSSQMGNKENTRSIECEFRTGKSCSAQISPPRSLRFRFTRRRPVPRTPVLQSYPAAENPHIDPTPFTLRS